MKDIHSKRVCAYCGTEFNGEAWDSDFEGDFHYKSIKCPKCKRENRIKVSFNGSGHDYWNGESKKLRKESLEKKVEKNG